jgi:hypothetical protein
MQSAAAAHVVLHVEAPHAYTPHDIVVTARQVPAPLQTRAGVYVPALHDSFTQVMPTPQLRHAPAPSHMPSC